MQKRLKNTTLLHEEQRTVKWFLWLFYGTYFIYDIVYHFILPETPWGAATNSPGNDLDYWLYLVMLSLLPLAVYLVKKKNPWVIKYIYFIVFTIMNTLNDIGFYLGSDATYSNGNVVEIVLVLFSPIFVNKRFFYLVSLGTILKFIIVGLVLRDPVVFVPIVIVSVLTMIAYILLYRFLSYVDAVKNSYDKQMEGIVKGVIATLELKDPYTRGHSERVAEYARMLAMETGDFKEEELTSFYYACLLHDIGKIHIPDSILSKPSKLTEEEFEIIKTHPEVGARAIEQVEGIDEHIDVILHHHERWDGKGYPDGLKGEETPLLTRLASIADAFDAMTSLRSYRSALSLEEAFDRILEGKGTQFDPTLIETFKRVFNSWVNYHDSYHNSEKEIVESTAFIQRR